MITQKRIYIFLLYLSIFVFTEGFGLRMEWMGGLGKAQIGIYGFLQFFQFIIMLICFFTENPLKKRNNDLNIYLKLVYSLFILIIVQLFIQFLFFSSADFSDYLNLIDLRSYLLFWTIYTIYRKIGLKSCMSTIKIAGIICSLALLFVVIFNIQGTQLIIKSSTSDVTRAFRILAPSASIISLAFFLFLSDFNDSHKLSIFIKMALCFCASFIQLHRSSTFSLIIALALYLILENKTNIKTYAIYAIAILVFAISLNFIFAKIGYSWDNILATINETQQGVSDQSDSNALLRYNMLINAFLYVVVNYGIIGIGLHWVDVDFEDYLLNQFSPAPTNDSGYYNIVLLFGIIGLIIYFILIFKLIKVVYGIKIKNSLYPLNQYARALLYFIFYELTIALGGDSFILIQGYLFVIVFALIYIINYKEFVKL